MTTYEEVKQTFQRAAQELQEARQRERPIALDELKAKIKEFNFSPEELGFLQPKARRISKQRYKDPKSDLIWTGQGRQPTWFKQRIREGYEVESLIDKSESAS